MAMMTSAAPNSRVVPKVETEQTEDTTVLLGGLLLGTFISFILTSPFVSYL